MAAIVSVIEHRCHLSKHFVMAYTRLGINCRVGWKKMNGVNYPRQSGYILSGSHSMRSSRHSNPSHRAVCPHSNCGESDEHYYAKQFIAQNIQRCVFQMGTCKKCQSRIVFPRVNTCLAEMERKIHGTNKFADVLLVSQYDGSARAAVEVFHTHRVDAAKRDACLMQGIPILEMTTAEVKHAFQRDRRNNGSGPIVLHTVYETNTMRNMLLCTACAHIAGVQHELCEQQKVWSWYDAQWAGYNVAACDSQLQYVENNMHEWNRIANEKLDANYRKRKLYKIDAAVNMLALEKLMQDILHKNKSKNSKGSFQQLN